MAEPNNEIPKISPSEVEPLIEKIWQNKLEEQDKTIGERRSRSLAKWEPSMRFFRNGQDRKTNASGPSLDYRWTRFSSSL